MSRKRRKIADTGYRQPIFNITSGTELFKGLRREKKGKELAKMTVTVGDWGRDFGGGLRITGWEKDWRKSGSAKSTMTGKRGVKRSKKSVVDV